jgi:GNAT superfamily N-acetyltransferase
VTITNGIDAPDPELARRLEAFLQLWLGAWPPSRQLEVAASPERSRPGWDGIVHPVIGVATPSGAVVSVPEKVLTEASALADKGEETFGAHIGGLVGFEDAHFVRAVFRYSERRVELADAGVWTPRDDPRVPAWLKPFNGDVLVAFAGDGAYAAGVGLKRHDALGVEIAVGTEPEHRDKGLAKRLVAQAARRIIDDGAVAIYLHAASNLPSAAVAEATGFPDRGWQVLGLFHHEEQGATRDHGSS